MFVESVLRYGLPPEFVGFTIKPKPKQEQKILDTLVVQFGHLGGHRGSHGNEDHAEESIPGYNDKDYKPFVFFSLKLDV